MKRLLVSALFCSVLYIGNAQYYFNDLVASQQSMQQYQLLKKNKLKKVSATSFEADGQPNEGFSIEQTITNNASKITTISKYEGAGNGISSSYYTNDRLDKNEDSSNNVFTTTLYTYNSNGSLASISTTTRDAFMGSVVKEVHQWNYNGTGKPTHMFKIKDGIDTTRIDLIFDEKGNVGEEVWKRKGKTTEHYYYYYNDKGQLADIVRFNNKARKMLPDFLFEYDQDGKVTQMTQFPANSSNYMIWKYQYDARGLKQKEVVFNKQQRLVGRVEYQYQ